MLASAPGWCLWSSCSQATCHCNQQHAGVLLAVTSVLRCEGAKFSKIALNRHMGFLST